MALIATVRERAFVYADSDLQKELDAAFDTGDLNNVQVYSAIFKAMRDLRDARYMSCLFSDMVQRFGFPSPILIDAGFGRLAQPALHEQAAARKGLFAPDQFAGFHPNEAEGMIQGGMWGNVHRDIDVRHYHLQANIWFPLHNLDEKRTLIFFPDCYRENVEQYGKLNDPDHPENWGFGVPLQVPLKLGDLVIFHSQHLHASPSQARHRGRLTVEIRIASDCIDDNTRIYRRLFWQIENFKSPDASADAIARAREIICPLDQWSVEAVVATTTAQSLVNHLFRSADFCLKAGFPRRPDYFLDAAHKLDQTQWKTILSRLNQLPSGEDLQILVARVMAYQGFKTLSVDLLQSTLDRTASYFWAFEIAFFAAQFDEQWLSAAAFSRAKLLAQTSTTTLDRYCIEMPPPRSDDLLQLLPDRAIEIADWALNSYERKQQWPPEDLDHRRYWEASFPDGASDRQHPELSVPPAAIVPTSRSFFGRFFGARPH